MAEEKKSTNAQETPASQSTPAPEPAHSENATTSHQPPLIVPQGKKGTKTCIIVALVVIGVFVLLGILFTIFAFVIFKKAADEVSKNADISLNSDGGLTVKDKKTGEEVKVNSSSDGSYTYTAKDGTVTTSTKSLPSEFPSSVPLYPGYKLESASTAKDNKTGKSGFIIGLNTTDSLAKVSDYYSSELQKNGWTLTNTYKAEDSSTFYGENGNLAAWITVTQETDKISISMIVGDKTYVSDESGTTPTP